jgi:tetratricopeptide (TPR) repeat protein
VKRRRYRPRLNCCLGAAKAGSEVCSCGSLNRGNIFIKTRNYVAAIREFSAAAKIAERFLIYEQLAVSLCCLAHAYKLSNDFSACENACEKAFDVILKNLGDQAITQAKYLAGLGELYLEIGKTDDGLDRLEKAIEIFWAERGSISPELMPTVMACFTKFLRTCINATQFEKADEWSRDIYEFSKTRLGEADVQTVSTLLICLFCARFLDQEDRVESITSSAREMLKESRSFEFTNILGLKMDSKNVVRMIECALEGLEGANCVGTAVNP